MVPGSGSTEKTYQVKKIQSENGPKISEIGINKLVTE